MSRPRVDVVLPVYNEERDLARSVLTLRRFLQRHLTRYQWRIVIADNASSDSTSEIGEILADQCDDVEYLRLEERGRGRAVRCAWQTSVADVVCYMDVDLSTDLEALGPLVASIAEEGYDLATGSRLIAGARVTRSVKREILSRGYNVLLKHLLRVEFNDAQCGFKAMRRSLVEPLLSQVHDQAWFFDSELLIKAQWMGLRIKEIPVRWVEDPESRVKLWETSWNYIRSIARLRTERRAQQAAPRSLIGWICQHPAASDLIRNLLAAGLIPIKRKVQQALARYPQDNVLEVGCGSGAFSQLVSGRYVGIDVDRPFLEYAKRRYGVDGRVQFACHAATRLPYGDGSFDQAMLINVMHHLADEALDRTFRELGRVTRDQLIIVDMVPLKYNFLGRLCYRLDQGKHIRSFAEQSTCVSQYLDLRESGYFRSGINLHSWFVGAPKRHQPSTAVAEEVLSPRSTSWPRGRPQPEKMPDQQGLPLRILRIITRLNIGGPSIHAALLSTRLDPSRFSTCLVVGEPNASEGDLSELVSGRQARVIRLNTLRRPIRPGSDVASFLRLLRIVWQERPHIIHTHMAKAGALGRLAGLVYNSVGPGRRLGGQAVLVHTFHGHVLEGYFPVQLSRVFITIERWLARRTDCLIAVSQTIRDELVRKRIGLEDQWKVIPLGLDLATLSQLPLPHGATPVRVGMVGRLVPIKNPHLFLEALYRVAHEVPGPLVSGVIVGDGPLRQGLEQEVRRLGLEGVVRFTGWQRDLRSVYEGVEVACLTSWNEGTPVALIEAMAAGRAVIATDVGGVRDLLADDGETIPAIEHGQFHVTRRGILIRSGDAKGLAVSLTTVARDPLLLQRLGEAGRSYVLRCFSAPRLIRDISGVYEELWRLASQGFRGGEPLPTRTAWDT